jgi:uncharacterized phosphosugar-binding protein
MTHVSAPLIALALLLAFTLTCASAETPAGRYVGEVLSLLRQVELRLPVIARAGDLVAEHLAAGRALYLGGSYEGFVIEAYYRAGGMMKAARLTKPEDLKPGDVLLLGTVEQTTPQDTATIREARARGALVVRIGPDPHRLPVAERPGVDLAVPCEGVAAAREAGRLPLASVGDTMVLWALTGEIVSGLTRRGKMTPMFQSVLVPGGRERNAEHLKLDWEPTCPPPQRQGLLGRSICARCERRSSRSSRRRGGSHERRCAPGTRPT